MLNQKTTGILQNTLGAVALVAFPLSSSWGQDCFNPSACEDSDRNGVVDTCETGLGTGLIGSYYLGEGDSMSGVAPIEHVVSRLDATIDFRNGAWAPEGLPTDKFWVRWTGMLTPDMTGTYQIATLNDDGIRVRLGDEWIIESWDPQSGDIWHTAEVDLETGVPVLIVIEYFEDAGSEVCELYWREPGETERVIIATEYLSPSTDMDGDGYPDFAVEDCDGDGISDAAAIASGLATDCDENCVPDECDLISDDVLAYYRFESTGLLGIDSSGNARHLTTGAPASFTTDRPLAEVTRTGDIDNGALSIPDSGQMRVADPDGYFAIGDQSFTVEAWLKITSPSSTSSSADRQYLLQKKGSVGDVNAGYQLLAQAGNIAAAGNWYGKSSNRSGNELVARFGNGSTAYTMISRLQLVNESRWYHVSFAVDQENQRIRFEVDGMIEWQNLPGLGNVPGTGALRIGTHTTSSGDLDQHLYGLVDELRIMRGVVPLGRMLNRTTTVDECEKVTCPADYDENGSVDGADLTQLLGGWATVDAALDLDGDGVISGADLTILLGAWGPCS